jgi:hypothetical protein
MQQATAYLRDNLLRTTRAGASEGWSVVVLNLFGAYPAETRMGVPVHAGTQSHRRRAWNPGLLRAQEHGTYGEG